MGSLLGQRGKIRVSLVPPLHRETRSMWCDSPHTSILHLHCTLPERRQASPSRTQPPTPPKEIYPKPSKSSPFKSFSCPAVLLRSGSPKRRVVRGRNFQAASVHQVQRGPVALTFQGGGMSRKTGVICFTEPGDAYCSVTNFCPKPSSRAVPPHRRHCFACEHAAPFSEPPRAAE